MKKELHSSVQKYYIVNRGYCLDDETKHAWTEMETSLALCSTTTFHIPGEEVKGILSLVEKYLSDWNICNNVWDSTVTFSYKATKLAKSRYPFPPNIWPEKLF